MAEGDPNHFVTEDAMLNVFMLLVTLASSGDPPTDAKVLQALPPVDRGIPLVYEQFRDDVVIVKNRAGETKVGPQVFVPFVGPIRLVQTNWACTAYYTQTIQSDFPFPVKVTKKRVQVIYMERAGLAK